MKPSLHIEHRADGIRGLPSSGTAASSGLLSAIVAACERCRRERGQPSPKTTLDASPDHERAILADAAVVRRAVEPLVRRAFESASCPDDSREMPSVAEVMVTTIDVGDAIEIEVADSGPPLADRVKKWLNDRNDSSDPGELVPEGAGLALAAVRSVVARMNGEIHAANCPEGGAAITLRLPRRQALRMAA